MGVFAKLLRRSSSKSTQGTPEATPAEETQASASPGQASQADAEEGDGADTAGPRAGEQTAESTTSRESPPEAHRDSSAAPADPASAPGSELRQEGSGNSAQGENVESDTADAEAGAGRATGVDGTDEGTVDIPKQQSAEEAADSESGDNARK